VPKKKKIKKKHFAIQTLDGEDIFCPLRQGLDCDDRCAYYNTSVKSGKTEVYCKDFQIGEIN